MGSYFSSWSISFSWIKHSISTYVLYQTTLSSHISPLINNLISQFAAIIFEWPLFKITSVFILSYFAHTKRASLKVWFLSDCSFPVWNFEGGESRKQKGLTHVEETVLSVSFGMYSTLYDPRKCVLWETEITHRSNRGHKHNTSWCSAPTEFKAMQGGFKNILALANEAVKFSDIS